MRNEFRRLFFAITLCASLVAGLAFPGSVAQARDEVFPAVIPLPNGWLPEGIAIGPGPTFYSGSRADGAIYRGDLRTGEGEIFIQGQAGRVAVGLKYDPSCDILLVAGGGTGQGYVYNGSTGAEVNVFQFTTAGATAFINDVVVTKDAAYFTNSRLPELYRVDLSDCGNPPTTFETITLSGDWQQVEGFNANGLVAHASGRRLIIVNSALGSLFLVNPSDGQATLIDLGEANVANGDGLLLRGKALYVVQNSLNQIAVIKLGPGWSSGEVVDIITQSNFDVPTTIGRFGSALYAINARFGTPNTPTTPYNIVRVELD